MAVEGLIFCTSAGPGGVVEVVQKMKEVRFFTRVMYKLLN